VAHGTERRSTVRPSHLAARIDAARTADGFRVLAGVDEAGLGPILGPLSIGWASLRVDGDEPCPWRALARVVSRRAASDRKKLVVADSKEVFARNPRGERRLERTVLAFLGLLDPSGLPPPTARALLERGPPSLRASADELEHGWMTRLADCLPLHVDAGALELETARLARTARSAGVTLLDAGTHLFSPARLNASLRETDNKSRTHWDACAPVIAHLWTTHADEGAFVVVDRHGGRMRYGRLLSETLDDAAVDVVHEEEGYSEYTVRRGRGRDVRMRLAFSERGERFAFPTALGSCLAKHARELAMQAFNAWFGALQPGLRPTAGYYSDGKRWLDDAGPALERCGLAMDEIVRDR
jgi:ribonuclease HII